MALRLGGRDRSRHLVRVARRTLEATAPRRPRREALPGRAVPSVDEHGHGRALRHRRRRDARLPPVGGVRRCAEHRRQHRADIRLRRLLGRPRVRKSSLRRRAPTLQPLAGNRARGGVGRQPAARRAARGRPSVPGEAGLLAGGRRALRLRLAGAARVDGHLAPYHRRRGACVLERDLSRHGYLRGRAVVCPGRGVLRLLRTVRANVACRAAGAGAHAAPPAHGACVR